MPVTACRVQGSPSWRGARTSVGWIAVAATLASAALILVALMTPSAALASGCTDTWENTSGGSWFVASNWSTGKVPTATDEVCINKEGTYTVSLEPTTSPSEVLKALTLGHGSGTGTQRLTVASTASTGPFALSATKSIGVVGHGALSLTSVGAGYSTTLSGTITNAGRITAEAGAGGERIIEGNLTNTGTLALNAPGNYDASGKTLTNKGSVTLAEGVQSVVRSGASFSNTTGGSVVSTGGGRVSVQSGGTFVQGAGTTSDTYPVVIEGGALVYSGSGKSQIAARGEASTLSGNLAAGQTLSIQGSCSIGQAILTASASFTNAGSITLGDTGICGAYESTLAISSGTLTNAGTLTAEYGLGGARHLTGNLTNTGTVSIADGTTLPVTGTYDQSKSGRLRTEIGSASSFGSLAVTGTATLAGTLEVAQVNGFKATAEQKFAILTASSRSGKFDSEKGAVIAGGLYYAPILSATGVTLEATEVVSGQIPLESSPPTIGGLAKQGQTLVLSHGSWAHEALEYSDQWLRCDGSGSGCHAISDATGQSYLVSGSDAGHTLRVQEVAYNTAGESAPAQSSATAVVQVLALKAVAGESITTVTGVAVTLDGSASTPASDISNYRWDFGDGQAAEGGAGAVVHHVYASAGKYTATLTITRGAETSTATVAVTVNAPPTPSKAVTVTVKDAQSQPIEGAAVLYVGADGTRTEAATGAAGEALLGGLPEGTATIYVYKSGYRPATAQASVDAEHHGSAAATLNSGEIAAQVLDSHPMTPAEIEAAGIDPNNPANQNVYDFEARLAFFESAEATVELHQAVNSAGQFVGGGGGGGGGGGWGASGGGGGFTWTCSPTECEGVPAVGSEGDRIIAVPHIVENHPLIQWLILRGKATVLKQFFEVSLVTQNLSEEAFKLTNGSATLNVPEGMSLAPTPVAQSATQQVLDIPGGASARTNWIIRGDVPGKYLLSADYEAKLQPFDAPVDVQAGLQSPLRVWGKDALTLSVKADSGKLHPGVPYHVTIGVTNKADVPLYNLGISIDPTVHANFIFQPQERFSDSVGELPPSQTLYSHRYILLPDAESEGVFNPSLSTIAFDGEKATPGEGIVAVAAPPLFEASAPSDTPGRVHLHWEAVPGAEGYEVFSTPDRDTSFAELNDAASPTAVGSFSTATLAAGSTDAYLAATEGVTRHYAVSALIAGRPTVESPMVAATAVIQAPAPTVTKLKPTTGPVAGGTTVTISGTNLTGASSVKFGATNASSFTVQTIKGVTSISAIAPAEPAATVDVTVTTVGGGTSAISTTDRFKYLPTVTHVAPSSGSKAGGTTVTITGTGFAVGATATIFKFGTTTAKPVSCTSSTTCTATAPAHAIGTVDVKATVNKSVSVKNAPADQFTYN